MQHSCLVINHNIDARGHHRTTQQNGGISTDWERSLLFSIHCMASSQLGVLSPSSVHMCMFWCELVGVCVLQQLNVLTFRVGQQWWNIGSAEQSVHRHASCKLVDRLYIHYHQDDLFMGKMYTISLVVERDQKQINNRWVMLI